jgi:hypothetical protein
MGGNHLDDARTIRPSGYYVGYHLVGSVRGWATRSYDGRTHDGYILILVEVCVHTQYLSNR